MNGGALLVLLSAVAGALLAAFLYARREPAVRGRAGLVGMRIAALLLLGLLLANPTIPGTDPAYPPSGGLHVLIHADRSLEHLPDLTGSGSLLDEILARARELEAGGARPAFGMEPGDLEEEVRRLAELGADTIVILSPFRIPPGALERLRAGAPVPLRLERFGAVVPNAGVGEFELPPRPRGEAELEGAVSIFGEGGTPGDSLSLEIRIDGKLIEERRLPVPLPGGVERMALQLPPPGEGTRELRYSARVRLEGDQFPYDDERVIRVEIDPLPEGILLLARHPDWEPGRLLPTLMEATGLDGEGYLRMADGRWLSLESGDAPVHGRSPRELAERIPRAALLVVQGGEAEGEAWLQAGVAGHPRVLLLPGSPGARSSATREWILVPEFPTSPVAPFLAGIPTTAFPPLANVRAPDPGVRGTPVLLVSRAGDDERLPALLLTERPEGRRAVALATGFWRWSVREGAPRTFYRALWAGVAGWLLERPAAGGTEDRGAFDPRDAEEWLGTLRIPPLEEVPREISPAGALAGGSARGRPLRTHPLPYLLLLGLLSAEWVGRRRVGLR